MRAEQRIHAAAPAGLGDPADEGIHGGAAVLLRASLNGSDPAAGAGDADQLAGDGRPLVGGDSEEQQAHVNEVERVVGEGQALQHIALRKV